MRSRPARTTFLLLIIGAIITACAAPPILPTKPVATQSTRSSQETASAQTIPLGDSLSEATGYLTAAENSVGSERQRNLLLGAVGLLNNGQVYQAQQAYAQIDPSLLEPDLTARYSITGASIALMAGDPQLALARSQSLLQSSQPDDIRSEGLLLSAQSENLLGQYAKALDHLIQRGQLLNDRQAVDENRHQIAQILLNLNANELQHASRAALEPEASGWIELMQIYRQYSGNPAQLSSMIDDWQTRYPKNPARDYLAPQRGGGLVRQVALLLPLTSPFANAAAALQQGFMDMHGLAGPDAPTVKTYDTGENETLLTSFYQTAINEGADLVIGPLGRTAVQTMAEQASFEVPTLMLGIAEGYRMPNGVYQLALSPEQEAQQVAQRAWLDGRRTAVMLYPSGDWGNRVADAFKQHWEELGGILLAGTAYPPKQADFSSSIGQLLALDASNTRKSALQAALGRTLEFDPRRRQDLDLITLFGTPNQGRLIKPQLDFYGAGKIPVYSTSNIYSGNPNRIRDTDLDGVRFGDMPWVFSRDSQTAALKQDIQSSGRRPLSGNRLYALGVDAYRLIPYLSSATTGNIQLNGASGRLQLSTNGVFQRWLTWAQFRNGIPQLMDDRSAFRGGDEMDSKKAGAGATSETGTVRGAGSQ